MTVLQNTITSPDGEPIDGWLDVVAVGSPFRAGTETEVLGPIRDLPIVGGGWAVDLVPGLYLVTQRRRDGGFHSTWSVQVPDVQGSVWLATAVTATPSTPSSTPLLAIVSAAVNGTGRLILTYSDGSTVDAGYVVGPTGPKGDAGAPGGVPLLQFTPPNPGTRQYVRLARIDGLNATAGAHMTILLSAGGDIGTAARSTHLIHFTQRGDNVVALRVWSFGADAASMSPTFYTTQVSTYVFDLWGYFPAFPDPQQLSTLANTRGTLFGDSATATAPVGLSAEVASIELAAPIAGATSAATANALAKRDGSANAAYNEVFLNGQLGASSATRKDYVDGQVANRVVNAAGVARIEKLTQAAYDALATKVADTLYVIVG